MIHRLPVSHQRLQLRLHQHHQKVLLDYRPPLPQIWNHPRHHKNLKAKKIMRINSKPRRKQGNRQKKKPGNKPRRKLANKLRKKPENKLKKRRGNRLRKKLGNRLRKSA